MCNFFVTTFFKDLCCYTRALKDIFRGRNNSKFSGSQQDYLVEKSGSHMAKWNDKHKI